MNFTHCHYETPHTDEGHTLNVPDLNKKRADFDEKLELKQTKCEMKIFSFVMKEHDI